MLEQTPIAVVVRPTDDAQMVFVYFISASNRRLMRARKPLDNGEWKKDTVARSDAVDAKTDLAATAVHDGNFLSFILEGNTTYEKLKDAPTD